MFSLNNVKDNFLYCISVELRGFLDFKPLGGVNFLTLGAWWWLALGWLVLDGFGLRAGIAFAAARQLSWQIIVLQQDNCTGLYKLYFIFSL